MSETETCQLCRDGTARSVSEPTPHWRCGDCGVAYYTPEQCAAYIASRQPATGRDPVMLASTPTPPGPAAGARVEELLIAQRGPVQERLVHLLYRFATDVCGIANDDAEKYANEVVTDCLWRTGIRGTDMGEECGRFARTFAAALRERDAARGRTP